LSTIDAASQQCCRLLISRLATNRFNAPHATLSRLTPPHEEGAVDDFERTAADAR